MLTYSIAIRTLGTAGEKFREELLSITRQTIQPERVIVYIAEGYPRPEFTVGREEYVWVKKGMVAQRVLPYDEIESDVILMLDDDVRLSPDSAEKMLAAMEQYGADCVGADTFKNQDMSFAAKFRSAVANLVFPHWSNKWAFKIRRNGSFLYNNNPKREFYWSQSCAGPASMWRKSVYGQLQLEEELWLDRLPFAYGEDVVIFYKLYKAGFRLGILYDAGCDHLDGGASSIAFRKSSQWVHTRTMASFIIWWRVIYRTTKECSADRIYTAICFTLKCLWLLGLMSGLSVIMLSPKYIASYIKGLTDGWRYVHSCEFKALRDYDLRKA